MIEEIAGPQIGAPAILEQASAKRYGKFYASGEYVFWPSALHLSG
jgi:hypothetical protein